MIAEQIEQAVSEVMVWETGTFEFAIDDLRPIDDIALYPSDVLPDADINTQMVLLEAARIFDERNRDGTHPALPAGSPSAHAHEPRQRSFSSGDGYDAGDSTHPTLIDTARRGGRCPGPGRGGNGRAAGAEARCPGPTHAAERLRLQIVSADIGFGEELAEALENEVAGTELVPIDQAGNAEPASRRRSCCSTCGGGRHPRGGGGRCAAPTREPRSSPWSSRAPPSRASTRWG